MTTKDKIQFLKARSMVLVVLYRSVFVEPVSLKNNSINTAKSDSVTNYTREFAEFANHTLLLLENQKNYIHKLFTFPCTVHTLREVLSLNVIIHLGSVCKQAAAGHAGHCPLLRVSAKVFFQSMFAPHHCATTCQIVMAIC